MNLEDIDAIRRRPGMYVGDVSDGRGLHSLVGSMLDNSIDQHFGGLATTLAVTLGADGEVEVEDDGSGIDPGGIDSACPNPG